jgi:hypothetical protein
MQKQPSDPNPQRNSQSSIKRPHMLDTQPEAETIDPKGPPESPFGDGIF